MPPFHSFFFRPRNESHSRRVLSPEKTSEHPYLRQSAAAATRGNTNWTVLSTERALKEKELLAKDHVMFCCAINPQRVGVTTTILQGAEFVGAPRGNSLVCRVKIARALSAMDFRSGPFYTPASPILIFSAWRACHWSWPLQLLRVISALLYCDTLMVLIMQGYHSSARACKLSYGTMELLWSRQFICSHNICHLHRVNLEAKQVSN